MTQPNEAVGGANDPVIAAEPTLDDRFSAALTVQEEEDPEVAGEPEEPQGEPEAPELTEEDVTEAEAEEEAPPIAPPVSWTAEEKEEFKNLPRNLQETLSRRESEREKFVQSKAQEAKQTETRVRNEAVQAITDMQANYMANLQALMPQVPQKPSHQLQADDPWEFAAQMDHWERAVAHRQFAEQQIGLIVQQQQAAQQARIQQAQAEAEATLKEKFPEYLDPTEGPKHKASLEPIAQALGYSLSDMDGNDIIALREVANMKAKADKYDALMAQKMAKVRAAKDLPRVSKPGASQGPQAAVNARYQADRNAMRGGDQDAAARVFKSFI